MAATTTSIPTIRDVEIAPDEEGYFHVEPVWAGVDRPRTGGYLIDKRPLAERLRRAMLAGAVYLDPEVRTDVNGQTFASARTTVLGRTANADLRRLGF